DELCRFLGLLTEQHAAVVGQDADGIAVQRRPAGHQRRAVERLELVELRAVDDTGDYIAWGKRDTQVGGNDADQFFGVEQRLRDRGPGAAPLCATEAR